MDSSQGRQDSNACSNPTDAEPVAMGTVVSSPHAKSSTDETMDLTRTEENLTTPKQEGTTIADLRKPSTVETEPEQSSCTWRVPPKKRVDVDLENVGKSVSNVTKPSNASHTSVTDEKVVQKVTDSSNSMEKSTEDQDVPEGGSMGKKVTTASKEQYQETSHSTSNDKSTVFHELQSENNQANRQSASKPNRTVKAMHTRLERRQKRIKPYVCHMCQAVIWGQFKRFRLHINLHLKYNFRKCRKTKKFKDHPQKKTPRATKTAQRIAKSEPLEKPAEGRPKRSKRTPGRFSPPGPRSSKVSTERDTKRNVKRSLKTPKASKVQASEAEEDSNDVVSIPIPKDTSSLYLCAKCCVGFRDVMELVSHVQVCPGPSKAPSVSTPSKKPAKKTSANAPKTAAKNSRQQRRKTVIVKADDETKSKTVERSSASRRRKPKVVIHREQNDAAQQDSGQDCEDNSDDDDWLPGEPDEIQAPKRIRVKKEPAEHVCKECGSSFRVKAALKRHWQTHEITPAKYQCQFCTESFQFSSELTAHLDADHASEVEEEDIKPLSKTKGRKRRTVVVRGKKAAGMTRRGKSNPHNECPVCHRRFSHHSAMLRHKKLHSGDRPHQCTICDWKFTQSCHLKSHITKIHMLEGTTYKCSICYETFEIDVDLRAHLEEHGSESIPQKPQAHMRAKSNPDYECPVCHKQFSHHSAMVRHKKLHSGDRPHQCTICDFTFTQSGHLKTHITKVHMLDGTTYKCSICNETFALDVDLKAHLEQHLSDSNQKKPPMRGKSNPDNECPVCRKRFSHHSAMVRHKKFHTGDRCHKCNICNRKFTQSCHLKSHIRKVHTEEGTTYKCLICKATFEFDTDLKLHLEEHGTQDFPECPTCGKSYVDVNALEVHIQKVHEGNVDAAQRFSCNECGKKFNHGSSLTRHKYLHQGIKRHKCDKCPQEFLQKGHLKRHRCGASFSSVCMLCGKSFSSNAAMRNHELSIHKGTKDFKCPTCDKGFATSQQLRVHVGGAHGVGKNLCHQCGKSFSFKSSYLRHLKLHTGAKPYACQHCDKTFTQSSHCKAHEMTHTLLEKLRCEYCGKKFKNMRNYKTHLKQHRGAETETFKCYLCDGTFENKDDLAGHMDEKCYQVNQNTLCKTCNKDFPTNSHLVRHMRVHTNERPFVCDICDKGFTQNSHLKNHVLRHSKAKPWQCEVCGRSYATRDYLKQHVRKIHEEQGDGKVRQLVRKTKRTDCETCGKVYKNRKYLKVHLKKKHSGVLFKQLITPDPNIARPTQEVKKDLGGTPLQAQAPVPVPTVSQETLQNLLVYPTVTVPVSGENMNKVQMPVELHAIPQTSAMGIPVQQTQVGTAPGTSLQIQVPQQQHPQQQPQQQQPRPSEAAGPNMIADSMRLITVNWW